MKRPSGQLRGDHTPRLRLAGCVEALRSEGENCKVSMFDSIPSGGHKERVFRDRPRAGHFHQLAGRIWPAGHTLDMPVLNER